jgi:hypothetical protein
MEDGGWTVENVGLLVWCLGESFSVKACSHKTLCSGNQNPLPKTVIY